MHDGEDAALPDDDLVGRKRRKGIYILPNLFTLAALFGGFYAIVMAMNGRFDQAAIGVFCAMVLDSLCPAMHPTLRLFRTGTYR